MFFKELMRILGLYFVGFFFALLVPFIVAFYYEYLNPASGHPQPHTTLYFLYSLVITLGLGFGCLMLGKSAKRQLYRREGIAAVVLIWLITPLIASMPFIFSGALTNPYQAYFEMVSGFTTTGSTVLQAAKINAAGDEIPYQKTIPGVIETKYVYYGNVDPVINPITKKVEHEGIEALSKALLFWRSFTEFLGGGGVVVLFVAILPALGVGGKLMFRTEIPGPLKEGVTPRIKETAIALWKIYILLTFAQIAILLITNSKLRWLDAITLSFGTLSTGGFTITNQSIASYNNQATEWVTILFMILGSLNFSLYYYSFKGKLYKLKDSEFILYILIVLILTLAVSYSIIGAKMMNLNGDWMGSFNPSEAFRYGIFQAVSAITTTGFVTTNYDIWPYLPQVLMLIAMYMGGMSGSTAGGIKTIRLFMLFRIAQYKVESIFRPESVRSFRMGGKEIDEGVATMVLVFFVLLIFLSTLGVISYVADGLDPETAIGLVACMINNVGMAFRMAGPLDSCAFMSDFSLFISSLLMILGRLEFFAFLAILVPAFWRMDS